MIILIFLVHSAYGNAITPNRRLLSTPPGYLPKRHHDRQADCPRIPADRKPGVDGIESPDYDQSHMIFCQFTDSGAIGNCSITWDVRTVPVSVPVPDVFWGLFANDLSLPGFIEKLQL